MCKQSEMHISINTHCLNTQTCTMTTHQLNPVHNNGHTHTDRHILLFLLRQHTHSMPSGRMVEVLEWHVKSDYSLTLLPLSGGRLITVTAASPAPSGCPPPDIPFPPLWVSLVCMAAPYNGATGWFRGRIDSPGAERSRV